MKEKKSLTKKVEDTMACAAFAEAKEPCPIGAEDQKTASPGSKKKPAGTKKTGSSSSVEDTMACSAFAEAGEPCPIGTDKSAKKTPKKK